VPYIKRIVLYGSVAEGKEERTSDVDIAVFISSKDERIKKDIRNKLEEIGEECIKLYGNPLHPYILTDEEFSRMGKEFKKRIEKGIMVFSK
jgi:predicted nucleotidyltransferase